MQYDLNDELLSLKFYATPPHKCSYLPDEEATTVFLDPEKTLNKSLYSRLSDTGFRRSGNHIYKPHCGSCEACIPVRIPVAKFRPNRTQVRCAKRGQSFDFVWEKAYFSEEHYELYETYIEERHHDGDMYPPSIRQYKEFLFSKWADTRFLSVYDNEKLIACSVVDQLKHGLSAVYTYFDPDYNKWSLGRLAIIKLVELCENLQLDYVYLGYLVKNCDKMRYKTEYRSLDCLIDNRWITLT